ncbi:tyrosine-type recombinase/integrase [Longispora fulva]|uniref:Integrase n=1 Tax=Longispora fulva TaxID=619741 RepID=A0A8J7KJP1_9ACTN|nr:tyrosine-type recombinase/integrase [Longispora fulva]MBG6140625.1 integrase [Longispora fulva]
MRFRQPDGRPATKAFHDEEQARVFDALMAASQVTVDEAMRLARALAVAGLTGTQARMTTSAAPRTEPILDQTPNAPMMSGAPNTGRSAMDRRAKRAEQTAAFRPTRGRPIKGQTCAFRAYAERWRSSRRLLHSLERQRHVESHLFTHIYPFFTWFTMEEVTTTLVLEWLVDRLGRRCAHSSLQTYFNLLNAILNAAEADGVIPKNPCKAINLREALKGISKTPKWVPDRRQTVRLLEVVPAQYKAAIWYGVGHGLRFAEVMGLEAGARCIDTANQTLHVIQQLRFHTRAYGGFYLCPPKSGSVGRLDLDPTVASITEQHLRHFPPVEILLPDISLRMPDPGKPADMRTAHLLFYDHLKRPLHDRRWALLWCSWREQAGWPKEGTFHSLRHFFATTMIQEGAEPTEIQHELRHAKLETTWSTYIHWWPRRHRVQALVSSALLREANES